MWLKGWGLAGAASIAVHATSAIIVNTSLLIILIVIAHVFQLPEVQST
jgi:hypothetical protein